MISLSIGTQAEDRRGPEDLEALREELHELSKQIEEAEHNSSVPPDNQAPFASPQAAELAGYRSAHNCP